MDGPYWKAIEADAEWELLQERRRADVEKAKERIRRRRAMPWWKRLLPFYISISFHWR